MDTLNYLSVYSSLLPLLVGMFFITHLDRSSGLLLLLLAFANVAQFASLLRDTGKVSVFFNVYTILDLLMWALIFAYNTHYKGYRKAILIASWLLAATYIAIEMRNGLSKRFYNEFVCINSVLQLTWVLVFFYEQYKVELPRSLPRQPMFWLCLGLLVYAPSTYFVFAFYNVIMDQRSYAKLAMIQSVLNVLMYLLFTVGMYMNLKKTSKRLI